MSMAPQTSTSPSGATRITTSISGDEVTFHLAIDSSAGIVPVVEAITALELFAEQLRKNFGVTS